MPLPEGPRQKKYPKVAEELTGYFLGDIGNSVAVTPESWENRPNLHAVYESLARLASPLL